MRLLGFKPLLKGTLRGFADVEIECGNTRRLVICDCPVLVGSNGPWVGLPGKPQLDRDGNVRKKPGSDKPEYCAVLKWASAADRDAFSQSVIKLLLRQHPDALGAEAAA